MNRTQSLMLPLPVLAVLAGCAHDAAPSQPQPGTQAVAASEPTPQDRRNSAAAAFLRRSPATAHPDDPDHCTLVRRIAEAFVADSSGPVTILADDARAIGGTDAAAAEREFVSRATAAQRELVRDRTLAGTVTADDKSALAAVSSLAPLIAVPSNAGAPATASAGKPAAPAAAERDKEVEDYLKRRGFKEHPAYTPTK